MHLEVTGRRERRIQRRIQDARFPMLKTLDAFSFEAQPDLDRDAVLQVFDCRFVAEAANVVFVGGVGTGKTHLSIALGMACCQHDYRVRFVTAAELVTLLVEAQQQGRLARKLAQLARCDLVICNPLRLAYVRDVVQGHVTTLMSNAANIEGAVASADLVLCSVLIPGARTPRLVTRAHLAQMEPGSALVDVAVDQGGCAETSRPTTHHDPRYVEEGVVHYCVSNMPGAVPHTSTYALTNATMAYALEIADSGWRAAAERDPALAKGVNVVDGQVTHAAVAAAHGLDHVPLGET